MSIEDNHNLAMATGRAFESDIENCLHKYVEDAEINPGLNYGYAGYCKTCGLAGWESNE